MKRSLPRKSRPYAILAAVAAAIGLTVLAAPGCGLQGEGQRCDRNVSATAKTDLTTGNNDCDTAAGLVCVKKEMLGGNSDICCPANNGASTNPNCQIGGVTGEGGGAGATTGAVTSGGATTSSVTSTSAATTTSTGTTSSASSSTSSSSSTGTSTSTGTGP